MVVELASIQVTTDFFFQETKIAFKSKGVSKSIF